MNVLSFSSRFARILVLLVLANLAIWPESSQAAIEETFAVLQIGTRTYRNVTVTTKAKNYIFIYFTIPLVIYLSNYFDFAAVLLI